MPPEALLQALRQRPFAAFRLYVSDGALYEVRHPDLVWLAPGYVVIGVPPAVPQPATIQRHEVVALQHVTRLEPIPALAATGDGAAGA
ncbi:MAG TPA: hypothetical protein VG013_02760 [Gemmataceae bacterium]|jgi:hypothetical protein|nr:hypothetical protein [Gemmataceae bacterium]